MPLTARLLISDMEALLADKFNFSIEEGSVKASLNSQIQVNLQITTLTDHDLVLYLASLIASATQATVLIRQTVNALFDNFCELKTIKLELNNRFELSETMLHQGWLQGDTDSALMAHRSLFRQMPEDWLPAGHLALMPLYHRVTDGKRHPIRAPYLNGEVYQRFIPKLGQQFSLRTVEPERDAELFHVWQNNPRVAAFWEMVGTLDEHLAYLQKVTADPHIHPVIAYFDAQPFAYFEIYWAKEDRIAPYYEADDYDRGVHMLVGEESLRGSHRVAAWLSSLAHYMFLADPRTRHVVAEPRADNAKMIGYMMKAGFYRAKEFDFPHKRAAMMMLSREAFFSQFCV